MKFSTYHSQATKPGYEWITVVWLPSSIWGVRFFAATEEASIENARKLYDQEFEKWKGKIPDTMDEVRLEKPLEDLSDN